MIRVRQHFLKNEPRFMDPAGERGGRLVQLACDRTNRPLLIQDQPYGPCFELLGELSSYPSSRLA